MTTRRKPREWWIDLHCGVLYKIGDDTSGRRCVTAQSMMLPDTKAPHKLITVREVLDRRRA